LYLNNPKRDAVLTATIGKHRQVMTAADPTRWSNELADLLLT